MKVNVILSVISLIGAALLSFLFYTIAAPESQLLYAVAISGFVTAATCLECGLGISWDSTHRKANAFVTSLAFLAFFVIEHCCFAAWGESLSWLVILTGFALLVYLLIIYGISNAKM